MEGTYRNINTGKKHTYQKRYKFQRPYKHGIIRTVVIVIHGLEVFDKQIRYNQRKRRTVNEQYNSPLRHFSTGNIRAFGGADARKKRGTL